MSDAAVVDPVQPWLVRKSRRASRWVLSNLFNSPLNIVLTVLSLATIIWALWTAIAFVRGAEWEVITANRKLLFIGRLPFEDAWRLVPALLLTASLIGGAYGVMETRPAPFLIGMGGVSALVLGFVHDLQAVLRLAIVAFLLSYLTLAALQLRVHDTRRLTEPGWRRWLAVGGAAALLLGAVMLWVAGDDPMAAAIWAPVFGLSLIALGIAHGRVDAGEELVINRWKRWLGVSGAATFALVILFLDPPLSPAAANFTQLSIAAFLIAGGLIGAAYGFAEHRASGIALSGFLVVLITSLVMAEQWDLVLGLTLGVGAGAGAFAGCRILAQRYDPDRRTLIRVSLLLGLLVLIPLLLPLRDVDKEQGVVTHLWGGFFLNFMLATAGIVLGLGIGILLAFGRMSKLPLFRFTSTGLIEFVRSGPLIAWLFIARLLVPGFLDPIWEADIIIRSILMLALFTGCYMAEILRGGLQTIGRGQTEAAVALGLTGVQTKLLILLPQAIRAVIPAMVSQMIALWKDTAIVYLVGAHDLFHSAQIILNQRDFVGQHAQSYVFAALMFWLVAFYLSRVSLRVEKALGVTSKGAT